MTDKTIKERGLTTITLPAAPVFSFDETTRRQELVWYYQYAVTNTLITVAGEQARTALIRKAFVHLGASGNTGEQAMRSWLQGIIPSAETNLYKLWLAYFTKYATTPDIKGVVYAGLSVEGAYRRFLSDFLGEGSSFNPFSFNFTDPLLIHDHTTFKQRKVFGDTVTLSEAVNFIQHYMRTFSDSYTMSDSMTAAQRKFFSDSFVMSDVMVSRLRKIFGDTVLLSDVVSFVTDFIRVFSDTVLITDAVKYRWVKGFSDSFTMSDAMSAKLKKVFADSYTMSDAMTLFITFKPFYDELILVTDVFLLALKKSFADTVTISDSAVFAFGGYNAGYYNDGAYNH